jgi:hypothetical protein
MQKNKQCEPAVFKEKYLIKFEEILLIYSFQKVNNLLSVSFENTFLVREKTIVNSQ